MTGTPAAATFDTGALVAILRADRVMKLVVENMMRVRARIYVPSCVLAQAWRPGPTQWPLQKLLGSQLVTEVAFDGQIARAAGALLAGAPSVDDVVDASVVLCARANGTVVFTSDRQHIRLLGPELEREGRLHYV